ncbi:hypothetical protein PTI45_04632 [Paenibacillus nuruki]|uniref:Uncharacterized protein n=1 Tax=Paenibacillus nuruki TaxID=1886670 RepID=A0A1E3KXA4_9BACL|nr:MULTISPECIES: hypothetical protein [Paenibacillus]ODP26023.1 hypothetical protein PTI45_04632 [Paenibacillus nuruki]TKJ87254.1 hypothetical protein PaeCFBP13512_18710 [Paenibacillus sp. CFBP13512]
MQLETVVVLLFLSPIVIGICGSLFSSSYNITPVVIDQRTFVTVSEPQNVQLDNEQNVLWNELPALEESPEVEELLFNMPGNISNIDKEIEFKTSELPEEMNLAISDLFKGIDNPNLVNENEDESVNKEIHFIRTKPMVEEQDWTLEPPPEETDFMPYSSTDTGSHQTFDGHYPDIDELVNTLPVDEANNVPKPQLEKVEQTYGPEIMSRITTTPAMGITSALHVIHVMVGRIFIMNNQFILEYQDHQIRVGGIEAEGEFLVEGMFVKKDLFYVEKYEDLQTIQSNMQKAEAS